MNPFTSGLYVIQCKDWSKPVGEPVVRDLLGTVRKNNAVKGILAARSGFTDSARRFAQGTPIDLIDGSGLDGMLTDLRRKDVADTSN
jgi:restriction system protein